MFDYQPPAVAKMVREQQLAVMVPMGLGKTVMTGTAIHDLGRPRTLVVAPAMVVELDGWGSELKLWQHLEDLEVVPIQGTQAQRVKALDRCGDIDVISYENVVWLSEECALSGRYEAIVFDELSKLKTPGAKRYRRLRCEGLGAAHIPIRFGLTGTPVGNHLLDVWAEMFMVAGEKPLGPRYVDFRQQYFRTTDFHQRVWEPLPGAAEEIHERIRPYSFALSEKLAAGRLPELRVNPIPVQLPKSVRDLEKRLALEAKAELESGVEIYALSQSARGQKVRQLASGAVYTDPPANEHWESVHDEKLRALDEIVDDLQGEPLLVFYWFRHELERLLERFPRAGRADSVGDLRKWNDRKLEVLLAHPASAGHGLNLQTGGFNICWYTLPWSLELWKQANARLARIGQLSPFVLAHCLLAGEADFAVLEVLKAKGRVEAALLEAVKMDPELEALLS